MKNRIKNRQINLFEKDISEELNNSDNKIPILFRKSVPEITSTTYGTFSIYKYPAKFIPQVIAFILKKYLKGKKKIFDPFAGYGTVGLISKIYGYDYELWDLNPILDVIHKTATMKPPKLDMEKLIKELKNSNKEFIPKWTNFNYWYPQEFIPILSKSWGFLHSLDNEKKQFLCIPLMKITKYFSYCDEKVHKLYRSKYSINKIKDLLSDKWSDKFYEMLIKEMSLLYKKIVEYNLLNPKIVDYKIKIGIDVLESKLDDETDVLITSPPYLQAQEYIRSTKMDLFWLGYDEEYIRQLSKKEIPYRNVEKINIYSEKYYEYRDKIKEPHLRDLYNRYFYSILKAFENLGEKVKEYMFIFVGPAKVRTLSIPIDDIIIEHLKEFGWKHEITYIDTIVSRVMFKTEVNPASGEKDKRIQTEHLIVLKRK